MNDIVEIKLGAARDHYKVAGICLLAARDLLLQEEQSTVRDNWLVNVEEMIVTNDKEYKRLEQLLK